MNKGVIQYHLLVVSRAFKGRLYRQNGIQYTDKLKGFTKKVVSALDVLRKGTEGASMISELQSSSNNFVIKDGASEFKASNVTKAYAQQIQNDPSGTAQKEALLNNGIDLSGGSGGTISWNSHGAVLATSKGDQVSKETDLAHEMFHALDANRGLLDSRSENGIGRSEWQAVFRENILREQLGRPLRTHYITNVSSTNLEQSKLCVNSPLYIDTRLFWEQAIGCNSA